VGASDLASGAHGIRLTIDWMVRKASTRRRTDLRLLCGNHLPHVIECLCSLALRQLIERQEHFSLVIRFGEEIRKWDLQRTGERCGRIHVCAVYFLLVAIDSNATFELVTRHEPSQRALRQAADGTCLF